MFYTVSDEYVAFKNFLFNKKTKEGIISPAFYATQHTVIVYDVQYTICFRSF